MMTSTIQTPLHKRFETKCGTGDGGTGFLERSGSFPEQDEGSQKFKGRCGNLCGIVDKYGYKRIPVLKEYGNPIGGRVFFVEHGTDVQKLITYLQDQPEISRIHSGQYHFFNTF